MTRRGCTGSGASPSSFRCASGATLGPMRVLLLGILIAGCSEPARSSSGDSTSPSRPGTGATAAGCPAAYGGVPKGPRARPRSAASTRRARARARLPRTAAARCCLRTSRPSTTSCAGSAPSPSLRCGPTAVRGRSRSANRPRARPPIRRVATGIVASPSIAAWAAPGGRVTRDARPDQPAGARLARRAGLPTEPRVLTARAPGLLSRSRARAT